MAILFCIALCLSAFVHPYLLKIAKSKNLVDNPGQRKLQKEPVPVIGGLVVFFGVVCSLSVFKTMVNTTTLFPTICAMMIMLYLGTIDDILDINAWSKLIIEIIVCTIVLYGMRSLISNWQGLFGILNLPPAAAIPFSIFAMVGIINAINLIDGVDGLSSGICIFILTAFSLFLFLAHEYSYCALSVILVGALIPFFIHNVFGTKSKMFLGDGGALMIGVAISSIIVEIMKGSPLNYTGFIPDPDSLSLGAMCLAITSIPVFDTLRVMITRIFHGMSPFHADKTHLHHHLLSLGMSHFKVSLTEIVMDAVVIGIWFLSYTVGASIGLQYVAVIAAAILFTATPVLFALHRQQA